MKMPDEEDGTTTFRAWSTFKLQTFLHDLPPQPSSPKAEEWDSMSGRVWIQTDNQQIEQVFEGRSSYDPGPLRPVCVRIARGLLSLTQRGCRPRLDWSPFVEWSPRMFNALADHAANY